MGLRFVRCLLLLVVSGCASQSLDVWHTVRITTEFHAGLLREVETLDDYLSLEDRVFAEVRDKVYAEVGTGPRYSLTRYSAGSMADPDTRSPDYNRTVVIPAEQPRGGVLLLHGMHDSPYSLRQIGATLSARGYWIVGLRLPGSGTVPAGLTSVTREDMAAAVELALRHLAGAVGEKPIHIIGFSSGSALALDAALGALDEERRPMPTSLVLISPVVGAVDSDALAGTQATLGRVPGLTGAAFTRVMPEFNPYEYNSLTANARAQLRGLTRSIERRLARVSETADAARLPPILVFKSAVDAAVSTETVVDSLLGRLPDHGNKLVLFDINRSRVAPSLLVSDVERSPERLMRRGSLPFSIWLIGNDEASSAGVAASYQPPFASEVSTTVDLDLEWPAGAISLSHVALAIPPDDPLYGRVPPADTGRLYLGQEAIRGERGLLRVPEEWLFRMRYNPFYSFLEAQLLEWLDTTEPAR